MRQQSNSTLQYRERASRMSVLRGPWILGCIDFVAVWCIKSRRMILCWSLFDQLIVHLNEQNKLCFKCISSTPLFNPHNNNLPSDQMLPNQRSCEHFHWSAANQTMLTAQPILLRKCFNDWTSLCNLLCLFFTWNRLCVHILFVFLHESSAYLYCLPDWDFFLIFFFFFSFNGEIETEMKETFSTHPVCVHSRLTEA